ncbi:MAG: hypothetical protein HC840_14710 [Leptolyngbyaceae cyanobacterium RM2_2_4]|nr:hypothetical protein [Leptolyngbyaceae cyanobacterium RM2_2_4]
MKLRGYLFAAATAATAVAGLTGAAQAATFGNSGISFDDDTTVNFTFQESHGQFRSNLKVQEIGGGSTVLFSETRSSDHGRANDWKGTCGVTVLNCNTSFKFEAGKTYTLALARPAGRNQTPASAVYSTNNLNAGSYQQAKFDGTVFSGVTISFEDIGGGASPSRCGVEGTQPQW